MAFDEELADNVRGRLSANPGLTEKQMFGGIAFMIDGNMACRSQRRRAHGPRWQENPRRGSVSPRGAHLRQGSAPHGGLGERRSRRLRNGGGLQQLGRSGRGVRFQPAAKVAEGHVSKRPLRGKRRCARFSSRSSATPTDSPSPCPTGPRGRYRNTCRSRAGRRFE